ncbi:MAG: ABC transporter substrate-binding protein, partial [Dethiobacteria bacterium]|nr:ABC transporter substrate-binding protein [Dethiobacteria bacterium]
VLIFALLLLAGCGSGQVNVPEEEALPIEEEIAAEGGPLTITDQAGKSVTLPEEIDKVATLCGCAHRFLVYLEAEDMISGVRESEKREPLRSPWNMAISDIIFEIPVISGEDAETIIAVSPDIMIATQTADGFDFFEHELLADKVGIPLVILRPYVSFSAHQDNVMEAISILGKILDREERAEILISDIKSIISDLDQRTASIADEDKPTVYIGGKAWAGSHGIVSTSSMYTAFDFINAKNVAAEVGEENAFIDKEALLLWNPDYIFLESTGLEQAVEDLKAPEFASLKAIQNGNIYRIHPKIWTNTNYETVLVNAYYIGSVVYPEQFSDLNFSEKADEVYSVFLGKSVLDNMIEVHGAYERLNIN